MEAVMFDSNLVKIDKEIAKAFKVNILEVQAMVKEYRELTLVPDDKDSYAICRKGLTACVHFRTGIDAIRLVQNEDDQARIKGRNANAKNLAALVEPAENHLSGLIKGEDARLETIKAEEAEKQRVIIQGRVDELLKYGKPKPFMEVALLNSEEYDTFLFDVKEEWKENERIKAEEEATFQKEKARLAKIADEQDAERNRLADVAQRAKKARIAEEVILQKEKDSVAAQLKEIADEKARIAREESDKKAKIESTRKKMLSEVGILITTDDLGSMPDGTFQELYDGHKITWEMDQKELKAEAKEREAKDKEWQERLKDDKVRLSSYIAGLQKIETPYLECEGSKTLLANLRSDLTHYENRLEDL